MISGNFNTPPNHWQEISEKEFRHLFFMYIFKPHEYRQLRYTDTLMGGLNNTKLYEIQYEGWEDLGVAIADDWKASKLKFYKFGNPELWSIRTAEFAQQFSGDNS